MGNRLSGLDATFLHLESPQMPMHVGSLAVYELPAGFRGKFAGKVRRHLAERLPLLAPLRRRLWAMPLNITSPVWVDAEPDLQWHVTEHTLATRHRRGEDDLPALEVLVAHLHVQLLDRERPLWRFHVIDGLAPSPGGRRRVAIYTQLHHAAVDGQAAVALANVILDLQPRPRVLELKPSTRERRYRLSLVEMVSGALSAEVQRLSHMIRALPHAASSIGSAVGGVAARSQWLSGRKRSGSLGLAPHMALNAPVTERRAFATLSLPLPALKALAKAQGATLNDALLWLVSSALRAHYKARGELPRKSMVAAVPVSLRAKGDTRADNQASMMLVSLATNVADPARRLAAIKAASRSMKATLDTVRSVLPTDFPSLGVSWLTEAAAALLRRATASPSLPALANVVVSNVPGPSVPLYLAGARMLRNHPCSIVTHGIGLNVTVQSYDQSLDFGLMADAQALPDVRRLADALCVAYEEFAALAPNADDPSVATGARPARGVAR